MKGEIIVDFKKIAYCKYLLPYSSTSVVIVHGLNENKEKYKEVVKNFLSKGFSVYILDLPGHGESDGHLKDENLYYIDKFDDYVFPLKRFINDIVKRDSQNKIVLFGHSMGGLISTLLLEENPNFVNALILSAPMFRVKMNYSDNVIFIITSIMSRIFPKKFAAGMRRGDKNATWKWAYESIIAERRAIKKENAEKIDVPILLLQAGKDATVDNSVSDMFATYCKKIKKCFYQNSFHTIYMASSKTKEEYFNDIFNFIRVNGL